MSVFLFSQLPDDLTLNWRPEVDVLRFDDPALSAASLSVGRSADGRTIVITDASGKTLNLLNAALHQFDLAHLSFADGSRLLTASLDNSFSPDLLGGSGNDLIVADSGDNQLSGSAGNDTLLAKGGTDVLIGGSGGDRFVIGDAALITVTDFEVGLDSILLQYAGEGAPSYAISHVGDNTEVLFSSGTRLILVGVSLEGDTVFPVGPASLG